MANFSYAYLARCNLRDVNLNKANLTGADLEFVDLIRARLTGVNLSGANLRGAQIYGLSAWDVITDEKTRQQALSIAPPGQPGNLQVDDIEVAQFVNMIVNHRKLRSVINSVADRGVLLLGRFRGDGMSTLECIAAQLRTLGYTPIIFDFDRPTDRSLTETVVTLVGLSRFVIADLSGPSVPHELFATTTAFKVPFGFVLKAGRSAYAMSRDLLENEWVNPDLLRYKSHAELAGRLEEALVEPAEEWLGKRRARLARLDNSRM